MSKIDYDYFLWFPNTTITRKRNKTNIKYKATSIFYIASDLIYFLTMTTSWFRWLFALFLLFQPPYSGKLILFPNIFYV